MDDSFLPGQVRLDTEGKPIQAFVEPNEEYPLGMVFIDWLNEWRIDDYE